MNTLDKLQSDDFVPYLNQMFHIHLDGTKVVSLELVSVTESGNRSRPEARIPFSIHFLGPVSPQYLLQHTYHFEHDQMGALDLFIVPLGPERGRMRYEAILT